MYVLIAITRTNKKGISTSPPTALLYVEDLEVRLLNPERVLIQKSME